MRYGIEMQRKATLCIPLSGTVLTETINGAFDEFSERSATAERLSDIVLRRFEFEFPSDGFSYNAKIWFFFNSIQFLANTVVCDMKETINLTKRKINHVKMLTSVVTPLRDTVLDTSSLTQERCGGVSETEASSGERFN